MRAGLYGGGLDVVAHDPEVGYAAVGEHDDIGGEREERGVVVIQL